MDNVKIISSSVRKGRLSHSVALLIQNYLNKVGLNNEILDLKQYNFPLFEERFAFLEKPSEGLNNFAEKIKEASAIIIVSPVYNDSFPASLKNVIDLFYTEWNRKVIGICTATSGKTPGMKTAADLQSIMLKVGCIVCPQIVTAIEIENLNTEITTKQVSTMLEGMQYLSR